MQTTKRTFCLSLLGALAATAARAQEGLPRPAGELNFKTFDGKDISLAKLKGQVVAVMFFSTDCPHCQNASEALAPLYAAYKTKGFEILGLALNDASTEQMASFAKNHSAIFPIGVSNFPQFSAFAQWSLMKRFYYPFVIFVDRKGVIRELHQGAERAYFDNLGPNAQVVIEKLLAEKPGT